MGFLDFLIFWKKKKDDFPKDVPKELIEIFEECEKEVEKYGRTKDGHTILWEVINKRRGNQLFTTRESSSQTGVPESSVSGYSPQQFSVQSVVNPDIKQEPSGTIGSDKQTDRTDEKGIQQSRRKYVPI